MHGTTADAARHELRCEVELNLAAANDVVVREHLVGLLVLLLEANMAAKTNT